MRLCVDEILRSGRPALRLTPADAARPLRAGRYLLHAVPPDGAPMPALKIDVTVEGDERPRAGLLDFAPLFARGRRGRAVAAFVPVFVRQEAAALVVEAASAGAALPGLAWRLQFKSYPALYVALFGRFMRRVLARKESLKLLGTAFMRHGLDGVGAALWGDWASALSRAEPQSGFTARALACPERAGLPAGTPAAVPGLCLAADLSRGAALPALDAGFLARARLAGFDALCLPCGWDGQQLRLPAPVQRFLDDAACDFPFILRPTGPAAADRGLMAALAPLFGDRRALRVAGRPVLAAAPGAVSADGVFLAGDDGAVLTGDFTAAAADPAARLPDTPPVRFGRAAHAAIGKALATAAGRAGPAFVFVDLAAAGGPGPDLGDDPRFGHAALEALRVARARHAAAASAPSRPLRAAIALHAFYPDVLAEMLAALRDLPAEHKLFVSTTAARQAEVEALLRAAGRPHALHVFDNRGRDILPFLRMHAAISAEGFDLVVKVHTKKSAHRKDGAVWRRTLVEPILGRQGFTRILAAFAADRTLGMTGPDRHLTGFRNNIVPNEARVFGLARRLGLTARDVTHGQFFAGSMFVARVAALAPLMSLAIGEADFEPEAGQLDGTLAHAIERGLALSVVASGLRVAGVEDVLRRHSPIWNMSG